MGKIDLHIHSNNSDGDHSVEELAQMIKEKDIERFAITDHDSVKSIGQLEQIGDKSHINGVEMSTSFGEIPLHILGYFINSDGNIASICDKIANIKQEKIKEFLEDLKKDGYFFREEDILKLTAKPNPSKVDLSKMLVMYKYAPTVNIAFNSILGKYKLGKYVRQQTETIINKIIEDGGIPVLAHPGEAEKKYKINIEEVLSPLIEAGLQGIEVYNTKHTKDDEEKFKKIADEKNLLISGGSDYHGEKSKPNVTLSGKITKDKISDEFMR